MIAAERGYVDIVELLCENGADVNHVMNGGFSSLFIAVEYQQIVVVEYLVSLPQTNVNILTTKGATPVLMACEVGCLEMVKLLVEANADYHIEKHVGFFPF